VNLGGLRWKPHGEMSQVQLFEEHTLNLPEIFIHCRGSNTIANHPQSGEVLCNMKEKTLKGHII
jgi:hypothetical protein